MGMVAAHIKILHYHVQCVGSDIDESGRANIQEVESTRLSIKLCIQEHQQLLECRNKEFGDFYIVNSIVG